MYLRPGQVRQYASASASPFAFVDGDDSASTAADGRGKQQNLVHVVDIRAEPSTEPAAATTEG